VKGHSIARRMNASEAVPQVYQDPGIPEIWENHVKPYGSAGFAAMEPRGSGKLSVGKGSSDWNAVREFFRLIFLAEPRLEADGILAPAGRLTGRTATLAPEDVIGISLRHRRTLPVSHVQIRSGTGGTAYGGYGNEVKAPGNPPLNRRCLSFQQESPAPPADAEYLITSSAKKAREVTMVTSGFVGEPGDRVETVSASGKAAGLKLLSEMKVPVICETSYVFDQNGHVWHTTIRETTM